MLALYNVKVFNPDSFHMFRATLDSNYEVTHPVSYDGYLHNIKIVVGPGNKDHLKISEKWKYKWSETNVHRAAKP